MSGRLTPLMAALWLGLAPVSAQTLEGVTLGAPLPATLPAPEEVEEFGPYRFAHYSLQNGLVLTVWSDADPEGPALSVQLARPAPYVRAESPLPEVEFGVTSTRQLETRFGPAGPVYEVVGAGGSFGAITTHNLSYETEDSLYVVTFITMEDRNQPDTGGRSNARLDAIVLADRAFQERLWGTPSYPNPAYRPITNPLP